GRPSRVGGRQSTDLRGSPYTTNHLSTVPAHTNNGVTPWTNAQTRSSVCKLKRIATALNLNPTLLTYVRFSYVSSARCVSATPNVTRSCDASRTTSNPCRRETCGSDFSQPSWSSTSPPQSTTTSSITWAATASAIRRSIDSSRTVRKPRI